MSTTRRGSTACLVSLRIYTRSGDDGTTGLFGGARVHKTDLRVEALGAVDELNAYLGMAVAACQDEPLRGIADMLLQIQNDLFSLGADLATPMDGIGSHGGITVERIAAGRAQWIEQSIDSFDDGLPALRVFILPGGTPAASLVHVCRAVCRRAERRVCALSQSAVTNPETVRYLNRLSDLLFVLARTANARAGVTDVPWIAAARSDSTGVEREEDS